MNNLILDDAHRMPALFRWAGPVNRRDLDRWVASRGWTIPGDLLELWATTGGGDVFETERLLRPLLDHNEQDEVHQLTVWCRARGVAPGIVIFHEGLGFTGVRCANGAYVSFDGALRIQGEFATLEDWYRAVLRSEYAERYGLT